MRFVDILTEEFLEENYVRQGKTLDEVARAIGSKSSITVWTALRRYGIPRRKGGSVPGRRRTTRASKYVGDMSGSYFNSTRKSARHRGLEFSITPEEAWALFVKQKGLCALSGIPINFAVCQSRTTKANATASLDRVTSSRGYVLDNIQWVHKKLNVIKFDLEMDEFIEWCKAVANFQTQEHSGG